MPERKTRSRTSKTQEVKSNVSVDNPVTNCIKHSIKEQKKAATSKTDDNRATALIEEKTHSTKKAENDKVEKEVSPGTTKVFIKTTRNLKHQTPATNEVKEVPNVESKITTRKTRGKKLNQGNPSAEAINKPVQVETLVIALTEQIAETTSTPITKNNTQKEDSTIEKSAVNVAAEENSQPAPLTRLTRNNLHPVEKTTTRNALNTRASRTKSVVDPVEASLPTPTISTASSSIADPAETSPPTTRRSPRNNSVVDPAETSPPTTRQSPRNNTVVDPAETSSSTTRRSARNNLVVDSEESSSPTRRRSLRSTVKADEFSNVTNKYPLRKDKKSRVIKKIPNGKDKKSPTEDTSNMSNKAVSNRSTGNKRKSAEVADTAPTKKLRSERVRVSYTDGEIVWAYVPCFPAHPSRIVKKMTDRVPDWVKEAKPAGDKVLVEFFLVSENHTCWVNKSDIYPFGDPENDIVMLKKAKKCPKRARMREVRKAYIHVCELKKIDPTPQLEKGFS
ncbi:hypothetical protein BDB01DRAFT_520207 [Pilobolus umbonatus]|nr:hypothetical protein BDB01DRAFT_520207 [Pilobolus umbonatus]